MAHADKESCRISYLSIIKNNPWRMVFVVVGAGALVFSWNVVIKPHEMKRLQKEATQTAERLQQNFVAHSQHDLTSIETLFSRVKSQYYAGDSALVDDLNTYFKHIEGLEAFMVPPEGREGALVLFNPYIESSEPLLSQAQCEQVLKNNPDKVQAYGNVSVIPVGNTLCVYDPLFQMLAILNLKTTLHGHLEEEMMKGYFLALSEGRAVSLLPSAWENPWFHRQVFHVLGTHWAINVYPSRAYVEASTKRVFLTLFIILMSGLGLFGWWFLRHQEKPTASNDEYVAHLKQLALYDGVTNLPNRRYCLDYLKKMLNRASRRHEKFAVCFMDCDDFKKINDDYGHATGDQVLRHIADEVSMLIRGNDFFARFAGDEFCLILEDTASDSGIQVILNKIASVLAAPMMMDGNKISVSLSVGVAVYPDAGGSADKLLEHADQAMYASKRDPKHAYVIYRP